MYITGPYLKKKKTNKKGHFCKDMECTYSQWEDGMSLKVSNLLEQDETPLSKTNKFSKISDCSLPHHFSSQLFSCFQDKFIEMGRNPTKEWWCSHPSPEVLRIANFIQLRKKGNQSFNQPHYLKPKWIFQLRETEKIFKKKGLAEGDVFYMEMGRLSLKTRGKEDI